MFYQMNGILNNRIEGNIPLKDSKQSQVIIFKLF